MLMHDWTLIETWEHAGVKCEIRYDECSGDPYKEFDQLGCLVILDPNVARNYSFGDDISWLSEAALERGRCPLRFAHRYLTLCEKYVAAVPFDFTDYGSSGARASVCDLNDEMCTGFIVTTRSRISQLCGDRWPANVAKALAREFGEWRSWVQQEVYGWRAADEGCYGYYGDYDYVKKEAESHAEYVCKMRLDAADAIRAEWLDTFKKEEAA
jgi:hypothetical protein